MRFTQRLLEDFIKLLRVALYGWLVALMQLMRIQGRLWRHHKERQQLPVRERRASRATCVPIDEPAYKRPDPLIYSQLYLMKLGVAVTWDNPDIELWKDGQLVPSSQLQPDTAYEILVRIWNNSTEAPVIGLPVQFYYLNFGVGTPIHLIGETTADLGVKGGLNHPASAQMTWKTPATKGHYCILVLLLWPDDANPENNLGQENTDVGKVQSPAEFTFTLRNDTKETHTYWFEVDTYRIPELPPCDNLTDSPETSDPTATVGARRSFTVPAHHTRQSYPIPPGWFVEVHPQHPQLAPDEETAIGVKITAPEGFTDVQAFNIHAFHRRGIAGGVTLCVERKAN